MSFKITTQPKSDILECTVEKLDASNASDLKEQIDSLQKESRNKIILDMSRTKYCDSSGLSAILFGHRMCRDTNGKFILSGTQPMVNKLIKIAQLDSVLTISDTIEDASQEM